MKFIIGFLVTVGLLIFVFILIFRGGGSDAPAIETKRLIDYSNTSVVMQMTTDGPVIADQNHKQIRMTVGSTESTLELFQGYQGNLIRSRSYPNNSAAYANFLAALQTSGYDQGNADKKFADERGYCPTGNRYIMGIKDGERDIQRFWSTSCGGPATFKGKPTIVEDLFRRQFPDYDRLVFDFNAAR